MARNIQLARCIRLIRDLDNLGGLDLYELAERGGVSPRTVRRDLAALEDAGLPLVSERVGRRVKWRLAYQDRVRRLAGLVNLTHLAAFTLALRRMAHLNTSMLYADLEDLAEKLATALGPRERKTMAAIDAAIVPYVRYAFQQAPPEVLWPLVLAIVDHRVCRVTYRNPEAAKAASYQVLPLKLFSFRETLYAYAWHLRHEAVITLNLNRLEALEPTRQTMDPPPDFDAQALAGAAFGVFAWGDPVKHRLRFSPDVAHLIREREWHPTQKLTDLPGGGVELTFSCCPSFEVRAWVGSWGLDVEILEPADLRRELAEIGAAWAQQYGEG